MLSIIVPTYNEKDNVITVVERVAAALYGQEYELLFVDDSTDQTVEILEEQSRVHPEVRYIHRENDRGLATAVVRGFQEATGDVLAVMDADLQHPPELLVDMLREIRASADLVIPSRFVPGGSDGGLRWHRKIISKSARMIGQLALHRVRAVTDPMSGFFMVKKSVVRNIDWNVIGWKILLEVIVKGEYAKVTEIPYAFQERLGNESKMSGREQINYLRHVTRLVQGSQEDRRFVLFALVGLSGVVVNMLVFQMLMMIGAPAMWAGLFSALTAMTSNFFLNDAYTWPGEKQGRASTRFVKFGVVSSFGIVISQTVLFLLHVKLGMPALFSNAMGIVIATGWNFLMNQSWTWRQAEASSDSAKRYGRT